MALRKRGKHNYGDDQADLRDEIILYSTSNGYVAHHFADAACLCGGKVFRLLLDDSEGAAVRVCLTCSTEHPIGDSTDYLEDADLSECACPCSGEEFEITVGVSLYETTEDVKWLYLGCRCPNCGLVAVYGDWKNEYEGFHDLLGRV